MVLIQHHVSSTLQHHASTKQQNRTQQSVLMNCVGFASSTDNLGPAKALQLAAQKIPSFIT
jgi:hypothetical protein